jgi:hypothetical protein
MGEKREEGCIERTGGQNVGPGAENRGFREYKTIITIESGIILTKNPSFPFY